MVAEVVLMLPAATLEMLNEGVLGGGVVVAGEVNPPHPVAPTASPRLTR